MPADVTVKSQVVAVLVMFMKLLLSCSCENTVTEFPAPTGAANLYPKIHGEIIVRKVHIIRVKRQDGIAAAQFKRLVEPGCAACDSGSSNCDPDFAAFIAELGRAFCAIHVQQHNCIRVIHYCERTGKDQLRSGKQYDQERK